jgi:hypothetical protein
VALGLRLPLALPHCVPDSLRVGAPPPGTLRVLQGEGEARPRPLPHSVPPRLLVALLEKVALGEKEVLGVRLRLPQGEGECVALPHTGSAREMEGEPEMELVMVSVPVTEPLALG